MSETNFQLISIDDSDKYLIFHKFKYNNQKTFVVDVSNKLDDSILGTIKWFPRWRQYCFFPLSDCVFHDGCLTKITSVIKELKEEWKNEKRS